METQAKKPASEPQAVYLSDYRPPPFLVEHIELRFELDKDLTRVHSRMRIRRNPDGPPAAALALDGEALELAGITLDGVPLPKARYRLDEAGLRVDSVPDHFELGVETLVRPKENTELSGLYVSSGNFCTQCEAEGFRRITFFPDRPDVLARYTVTLAADAGRYPVLLSNGNLVEEGRLDDGRHWVKWEDPFPKPSYLFALVGGDLACLEDEFTTRSGRRVSLHIYVQHHNIDKCDHAMASLKRAMRWDEEKYGREYDLDRYMIVAVDDFNMGAMENKGLNIFNSKYVLARPETATDTDFQNIEGVIGHEYFHNWSGNRVTCRDWFQLSLKEGFTVYRDQEFSADMGSRGVKRIEDVNVLRTHQFREDSGPMAHPVRPESYVAIDNFYTVTVYNKGAEVVRMLATLTGPEGFRKGCDLYFGRHDGQAVTTDDFVRAMEDANGMDFGQFRRWYSQAGTPELRVALEHDAAGRRCLLRVSQSCPPTPGQPDKQPFHIPLRLALLGADGQRLPLRMADGEAPDERVLSITAPSQEFVFEDIGEAPVPSLLRGFSAPVRLEYGYSDAELAFLLAWDDDPFARWEAGQILARRLILARMEGADVDVQPLVSSWRRLLTAETSDPAFRAEALSLPAENYLAEFVQPIDPDRVHQAREGLRRALAEALEGEWHEQYRVNTVEGGYRLDPESVGRRALRNRCLAFLTALGREEWLQLAERQFEEADNMTDRLAALRALVDQGGDRADAALARFYEHWQDDPLVIDKWFAIQASARREDTLERVEALMRHPAFKPTNPNRVYALVRTFASANPYHFHRADGAGYALLGAFVRRLDKANPQVASRLATAFTNWRQYEPGRAALMREQLERISKESGISKDLFEIASKSLED